MLVLVIGDVIGKPGRRAVGKLLPELREQHRLDLVIANGENSAGGLGLTPSTAGELFRAGVDIITSGNHIWAHKEIIPELNGHLPILRPLNYPSGAPGRGYIITDKALVINLMGRTFIGNFDCPFKAIDNLLKQLKQIPPVIIIDFHAEATSEKVALGRYLDGRVSAVLGTHTHVATADFKVLPKGTAYITDIGMVGPIDSVIGDDSQEVINRFLTAIPHRLSVGKGRVMFNAVLIDIDPVSGKANGIKQIYREAD